MSEEEKKAIEKEFEFALGNLISGIKETTATEIVVRQQSMILLFRKLMHEIERRDYLIEKQNKVIDEMSKKFAKYFCFAPLNEKCKELGWLDE